MVPEAQKQLQKEEDRNGKPEQLVRGGVPSRLRVHAAEIDADARGEEGATGSEGLVRPVPADSLEDAEEDDAEGHEEDEGKGHDDCVDDGGPVGVLGWGAVLNRTG